MRRFHAARPVLAILLLLVTSAWAGHRTTGSVHVHGYTTRSGHYVVPYTRSAPHAYHAPALPRVSHPSTHATPLTKPPLDSCRGRRHSGQPRQDQAERDGQAGLRAPPSMPLD